MAEEFKGLVDSSFDKGTPLWLYTKDYVYGMVPADSDRWVEVSYTFEDSDEPLVTAEKGADLAYQLMFEEISKGLTFYIEDLKVPALKEFAKGLEGKSGSERISGVVAELINNTEIYTANTDFIVKTKENLGKLKEKL